MSARFPVGERLLPNGTLSTLLRAVEEPDPRTVREILSRHPHLARARLYDENQDGDTLLHRADAGIKLPHDDRGWSLEDGTAADHRKTAIVEAMIAAGARYEPRHLLQCGLRERLNRLLDREPERLHERIDLGHFNGESCTLLHVAVNEGLEEMVALLLARGADAEARDDKGMTVVCCALNPSHAARSAAIIDLLRRHRVRIDPDLGDHGCADCPTTAPGQQGRRQLQPSTA